MTQHPSDLTAHLGFWLRMVSNHVSQAFAARLTARDVTVAEWCVLRALYRNEPVAPSRLAQELGLTRGAITKLADRLIAKGMLTREASAADRRAQTLALTRRGAASVPALAALADDNDAECFNCLTDEERAALLRLLRRVAEGSRLSGVPID